MTKEEKQLLLKDLCGRLPYGVVIRCADIDTDYKCFLTTGILHEIQNGYEYYDYKPYLRPISNMTEDEKKEIYKFYDTDGHGFPDAINEGMVSNYVDYCNAHHIDYRGLIEKGLALEAPLEMYNKEESEKGSEVPIPKTVDDAVKTLAKIISKEDRDYILENGAISVHHSMGRWIRNEWGLWTGSELKNELKKKGLEHPDDMSNYIIEEFIKYWNNKI